MKPLVSLILPTYNEAGNIGQLLEAIIRQPNLAGYRLELIVVDDKSPDGTGAVVEMMLKRYGQARLIVRKNERGLGTAIMVGINRAQGQYLILMDTDFSHQPVDIGRLLQFLIKSGADLSIGSRYIPGGGMHQAEASPWQFFASKWGNFFVNHWLTLPVHESLSGFVAVKKQALIGLPLRKIFYGYGEYCIRLLYWANRYGFSINELPVVYGRRRHGDSKSRLLKMTVDYFFAAIKLRFNL